MKRKFFTEPVTTPPLTIFPAPICLSGNGTESVGEDGSPLDDNDFE